MYLAPEIIGGKYGK